MGSDNEGIDWYVVRLDGHAAAIGALGFINDKVVTIASFYDDRDANKDGKVSIPERVIYRISPLRLKGMNVVQVAMAARFDLEVLERDPDFTSMAMNLWLNFARGLVKDGMYTAWMGASVNMGCSLVAKELAEGLVRQFIVKKGLETVVRNAVKKSAGLD